MTRQVKHTPSIAMRLAALMERERIESLPRNYELLYDVYSGANPELTKEFMALGKVKTQEELDNIGRKHLPHQHEEGVLAKANSVIQSQMCDFLKLIQNEMSSLAEFEKIVDETSRAISSDKDIDRAALAKSIDRLSKATSQQAQNSRLIGDAATAQQAAVAELKQEMEALEAQKWTDPATGLANRRAFNKTMVSLFEDPEHPRSGALVFAELDEYRGYSFSGENAFNNRTLREIAAFFGSTVATGHFAANLEKGRFALVLFMPDANRAVAHVEAIGNAMRQKRLFVAKPNSSLAQITISSGIAMTAGAGSARQLIENAEKALTDSFAAGGDKVTLHPGGVENLAMTNGRKDWAIYERS